MLRGTNKRIIEISGEESSCFERIVLFVKPDEGEDEQKMMKMAQDYADGLLKARAPVSLLREKSRQGSSLRKILMIALGMVAAVGVIALCLTVF